MRRQVELACPVCGSSDIVEWKKVSVEYDIDTVETDGKGSVWINHTGEPRPFYELAIPNTFSCRNVCQYGEIEEFIKEES